MRNKFKLMSIYTFICMLALPGLSFNVLADQIKPVAYGKIVASRPTEISDGLFGMSNKSGMAYTIKQVKDNGQIEIDSPNVSFLVGDCVAMVGEGDKTTLTRTQPSFCAGTSRQSKKPDQKYHIKTFKGYGPDSQQCAHARAEASSWPAGYGRRRALMREMVICAQPGTQVDVYKTPEQQSCRRAWQKVENLPFGPARAQARQAARNICTVAP